MYEVAVCYVDIWWGLYAKHTENNWYRDLRVDLWRTSSVGRDACWLFFILLFFFWYFLGVCTARCSMWGKPQCSFGVGVWGGEGYGCASRSGYIPEEFVRAGL